MTGSEDMTARIWEVPPPLADSPERLMLSLQVATGMVLGAQAVADSLTPESWQEQRRKLDDAGKPQP